MRYNLCVVAALLTVSAVVPRALPGQATVADSAGAVYEAAQRLEAEGKVELARTLYRYIVRQYPGTPSAEASERRLEDIGHRTTAASGRGELMVWHTIYGAWLGVAIPAALGADQPEPYGLGLLLGAPAGFVAAKLYGQRAEVSSGQARVISFGSQWGTWQGLGWRDMLDIGDRTETFCFGAGGGPPCQTFKSTPDRAPWAAMVVGGLTGLATGAVLARGREIPGGRATFAIHGAYWGSWYGLAGSIMAGVDESDAGLAWVLVGGNIGLLTGALAAPRDIRSGRVWLITAGGIAGAAAGFGLDLLVQPSDEKTAFAIPAATSALGLILAGHWTRRFDPAGRDEGRGELDRGTAFVNVRNGRVAVSVPELVPTSVRRSDGRPVPALRVPLFDLRH